MPIEPEPTREEIGRALDTDAPIVARRPSPYRTSYALEEIDLKTGAGIVSILAKGLSRRSLDAAAVDAKPAFVYNPLREIGVYETILPDAPSGPARYLGSIVDAERERFWLFLEKVPGIELYQVGDLHVWKHTARWLAVFHEATAKAPSGKSASVPLIRIDRAYYQHWLERMRAFTDPGDVRRSQVLSRLERHFDRVLSRVESSPQGFLHGEFYASNVLVADDGQSERRVCPVDWEMAAYGPVMLDLAALTAGGWSDHDRMTIANEYYEAAEHRGQMASEGFTEILAACHILLTLQWLGWARGWLPPLEHRHNWVAEMERWLNRV